ncbi:hypothetical protein ROS1_57250 [Roseibium sp. ROS1]
MRLGSAPLLPPKTLSTPTETDWYPDTWCPADDVALEARNVHGEQRAVSLTYVANEAWELRTHRMNESQRTNQRDPRVKLGN